MSSNGQIVTLPVGMIEENCILIRNPESDVLYIIDPGGEGVRLLREIRAFSGIKTYRILMTHAHFDHISGAGEVADALEVDTVYVHPLDQALYVSPENCMNPYFPPAENLPKAAWPPPQDPDLTILPCPGHTPGGVTYYFPKLNAAASGDTLFCQGVGRTDFPGGNTKDLMRSIKEQLFALPDETRIIPGHGPDTSIGFEKENNPYIMQ